MKSLKYFLETECCLTNIFKIIIIMLVLTDEKSVSNLDMLENVVIKPDFHY